MKIIKLNAIDSTNSYLKELGQKSALENFTIVVTNEQKKGRGQQENKWISESFKNLTFSLFTTNLDLDIKEQKYLNYAVSLAIFTTLSDKKVTNLAIKWPNDILSANKKICGILIENTIKGSKINSSIIGIGLNVNQENFSDGLQNATSLKNCTQLDYHLDELLLELLMSFKKTIQLLSEKKFMELEASYLKVLYKKNIPSMFKDRNNALFMGKIIGISLFGNLLVELEDETVKEFGIKEISFV